MTNAILVAARQMSGSLRQLLIFGIVGTAAFLTHFATVIAIVPLGLVPLAANVIGFLGAVGVSYYGHSSWTFPTRGDRNRLRSLHRFLRVAVFAFLANEALFWILLRRTDLSYQLALIIVLAAVAAGTLLVSKYWAFADE